MRQFIFCLFVFAAGCGESAADKCNSVNEQVTQIIAASQPCTTASDCIVVTGSCGEANQCGATVNMASATKLKPLDADWTLDGCSLGTACTPCSGPVAAVTCSSGVCAGGEL